MATLATDAAGPDAALKDHTAQAYLAALERLRARRANPGRSPQADSLGRADGSVTPQNHL